MKSEQRVSAKENFKLNKPQLNVMTLGRNLQCLHILVTLATLITTLVTLASGHSRQEALSETVDSRSSTV